VTGHPLPDPALRALLYVAAYRARAGQGPTWRELRQAMGWSPSEAEERIRSLYAHGLRWRKGVERSLDLAPWARRALLAELGRRRVGGGAP
jgi:hypothetical protein